MEPFEPIAIVGMAARLPGAADLAECWRLLVTGGDGVRRLSDEQLAAAGVPAAALADPTYVKASPILDGLADMDADLFGLRHHEADLLDPQTRLFIENTHAAIEDAGHDPARLAGRVGVFGSTGPNEYAEQVCRNLRVDRDDISVKLANTVDYFATRTSYTFGFDGPSMTVLTACSSSLVAIDLACQALRMGRCDWAVAGGATIELPHGRGYWWQLGGARSRSGRCRPYSAAADGTVFGSGAATVLLRRLDDAIADGDHVRAVVRGIGITNDGADKASFSAPGIPEQVAAARQAMAASGLRPSDISLVEGHGTGTAVGDPIEVAALTNAYQGLDGETLAAGSILLGSVKANVGHLSAAAGTASLVKVLLALEHGKVPPTLTDGGPHPALGLADTPFRLATEVTGWPREPGRPRRAAVNSLGVGGTNVHLIVEEGPAPVRAEPDGQPRLVIWSGRTPEAAKAVRDRLSEHFAALPEEDFADAVVTLRERAAHPVRGSAVCADAVEAAKALADAGKVVEATAPVTEPAGGVALLFPGQGVQHTGMTVGMYQSDPAFRAHLDRNLATLAETLPELRDVWLDQNRGTELISTRYAQPLLFAVQHALAARWLEHGVAPTALLGHSVGELVAATVAGVFELDAALRLVARRGELMQQAPPGSLLAVAAGEDEVRPLLPDTVTVSALNAPDQTVVGGPTADVAALAERLARRGLHSTRVRTSHAFHTPSMAAAAAAFAEDVRAAAPRPPRIPVISATTGAAVTDEQAADPGFWAAQVADPVRFWAALDVVAGTPGRILLEVGPGQTLTKLARRQPDVAEGRCTALAGLGRAVDDHRSLLGTIGELWVAGVPVDLSGPVRRRVPLPGYPYQRRRHWIEPTAAGATPAEATPASVSAYAVPGWVDAARPQPRTRAGTVPTLALLPADPTLATDLLVALHRSGCQVTGVRPGEAFARDGADYRIRAAEPADLAMVAADLLAEGRATELVVHAWAAGELPADAAAGLELSVLALLTLVQESLRGQHGAGPDVLVLTRGAADVSGAERVRPAAAALLGAVRSLAAEAPLRRVRLVDLGHGTLEDDLVDELACDERDPVVALRGSRRWVRTELAYTPRAGELPVIRRAGTYLLTGGFGGLGLAVAHGLAATGRRPRLVLTGRTVPADDDPRQSVLAALRRLGAQVRTARCDVTDPAQFGALLDGLDEPLAGVLHLAGVAGGGMLELRKRADAVAVLAAKAVGTQVLADVLADRPRPDFVAVFSSRAALDGLVGGADYAGANAYADAVAAGQPGRWLSVNWPLWSTVGMGTHLAPGGARAEQVRTDGTARELELTLTPETAWELDEHRVRGVPILVGTAYLDLTVRAFRRLVTDGAVTPVAIEDFVFSSPMWADGPRTVVVRLEPDGERWRVRVRSRAAGGGDDWMAHATGRVMRVQPTPKRHDPASTAGLTEVPVPDHSAGEPRMFALGPHWDVVLRRADGEDGLRMAELALPPEYAEETATRALHPALLDVATFLARDETADDPHVPFMYRRLVLHRDLPPRLTGYLRRRAGSAATVMADVELVAEDGELLAEITGFVMRGIDRDAFQPTTTTTTAPATHTPEPADDAERSDPGLPPDTAVALLLELLGARTPRQVAVRPYRGGVAVPLPALASTPPAANADPLGHTRAEPPAPQAEPSARRPADQLTGTAATIAALWRDILGVDHVDGGSDFFKLGGDSLTAVRMMTAVQREFGVELTVGLMFDNPTLAATTALVERSS